MTNKMQKKSSINWYYKIKYPYAIWMLFLLALLSLPLGVKAQSGPIRITPLGDSLTSSLNGQASYRYFLWKKLNNAGLRVDFVGTSWGVGDGSSGIYGDFDQDHEGHAGATTDFILYGLDSWLPQTQPEVVLLCIGGNDFVEGRSWTEALRNTRQIIKKLRAFNPRIQIFWATLPPDRDYKGKTRNYNSGVFQFASSMSTKKSPIKVVDLTSNFYPSVDTVDGDHPSESGERKFANRFFNALVPNLRSLQKRR